MQKSIKKFILKSRPSGEVSADNFELIKEDIPELKQGEILIKAKYLSVDPYMRNRMNNVESYVAPFELESAITGDGIAEVINTKSYKFEVGDLLLEIQNRVDIYFDNVGGDISDGVFYMLNNHARIVLCGQISLYNLNRLSMGPRLYPQFLIRRVKMQGFIVYDYTDRFTNARNQIKQWILDGKIVFDENIVEGFEKLPTAFLGLFQGENIGKQLVKI